MAYKYATDKLITVCYFEKDMTSQRSKKHLQEVIEVEAKTAQEAIKIALHKLHAERTDVDIQLLREENKGLFSMQGARLAKVRVKKKLQKK